MVMTLYKEDETSEVRRSHGSSSKTFFLTFSILLGVCNLIFFCVYIIILVFTAVQMGTTGNLNDNINPFDPLQNIELRFKEEKLQEIVNYFDRFAKPILVINKDPPIRAITIERFMKFLTLRKFDPRVFEYPTYCEIMNYAELLKADKTRVLSEDQVIYILNDRIREPEIKKELKKAFALFDTERRTFLELDELKYLVTTYGDPFTEDETRELLRDANVIGDGNIFYDDFVDSMFSRAPELYEIKTELLYDDVAEDPTVPPEPKVEEEVEDEEKEAPPSSTPPPPPPPPKGAKKGGKRGKGKKGK